MTSLPGPDAIATDLQLSARDGFPLAGRLWAIPGAPQPKSIALINSGAGIQSRFYDRFAAFLAQNGVPTLVYDYRGIGRSRPTSLRGFKASVEEWGSKDCAAVLDWLRDRFPEVTAQQTLRSKMRRRIPCRSDADRSHLHGAGGLGSDSGWSWHLTYQFGTA